MVVYAVGVEKGEAVRDVRAGGRVFRGIRGGRGEGRTDGVWLSVLSAMFAATWAAVLIQSWGTLKDPWTWFDLARCLDSTGSSVGDVGRSP